MRAMARPHAGRRRRRPAARTGRRRRVGRVELGLEPVAGRVARRTPRQHGDPVASRRTSRWTKLSEPVISVSSTVVANEMALACRWPRQAGGRGSRPGSRRRRARDRGRWPARARRSRSGIAPSFFSTPTLFSGGSENTSATRSDCGSAVDARRVAGLQDRGLPTCRCVRPPSSSASVGSVVA